MHTQLAHMCMFTRTLCIRVYVYTQVHAHVCTWTHMCIVHTTQFPHVCAHMHSYTLTCTCTHRYTLTCARVYTHHTFPHASARTYARVHTVSHVCILTHSYTPSSPHAGTPTAAHTHPARTGPSRLWPSGPAVALTHSRPPLPPPPSGQRSGPHASSSCAASLGSFPRAGAVVLARDSSRLPRQ